MAAVVYTTAPEVLHGMGVVYWHQSIMQVTLLLQLMAFYYSPDSKPARVLFYVLCLVNPYIEWTGFVANAGFAFVLFFDSEERRSKAIKKSATVFLITIASLAMFFFHFILVLDPGQLIHTVIKRFSVRGLQLGNDYLLQLLHGYAVSFGWIWNLLLLLSIVLLLLITKTDRKQILQDSVLLKNKTIVFLFLFPVLENIFMLQHATEFGYDRIKLLFFLCLLLCDMLQIVIKQWKIPWIRAVATLVLLAVGMGNVLSYLQSSTYSWKTNLRTESMILSEYVSSYENSVLGSLVSIRGYANMTFMRGIYEEKSIADVYELTKSRDARYAIYLVPSELSCDTYDTTSFSSAYIIDLENGKNMRLL